MKGISSEEHLLKKIKSNVMMPLVIINLNYYQAGNFAFYV